MVEKIRSPKPVIVKTMTVNKKTGIVHNFFDNMKYMETGGAIRPGSLTKGNDGWWTFYHNIAGGSRMKYISDPKFGILDHIFIGGGLEWHVFVRIIPNEDGSTVTWTFIKPDGLSDDQFHKQLTNFDSEISNWKSTLAGNEK
ncbi:MAG: hypothetical protein WAK17_11940 [Candidatus Nitrosopolaris sp.]|jgi:hypothetical protein